MIGKRIRLNTPTLALVQQDSQRIALTVPAGAVVKIVEISDSGRFADVLWDQQTVLMFTVDLHERGEIISTADG